MTEYSSTLSNDSIFIAEMKKQASKEIIQAPRPLKLGKINMEKLRLSIKKK